MYSIAYNRNTKKILYTRYDDSVGIEKPNANYWLQDHCKFNNLNSVDYVAVDLTANYNPDLKVILGNHVFNESTGTIEPDPNWVAPAPPPEIPETPTGPSKEQLLAQLQALQAQIESLA
jgi:hypothetical protein